jgi:hypothetical protein
VLDSFNNIGKHFGWSGILVESRIQKENEAENDWHIYVEMVSAASSSIVRALPEGTTSATVTKRKLLPKSREIKKFMSDNYSPRDGPGTLTMALERKRPPPEN